MPPQPSNRRNFLKTAAAGAGGLILVGCAAAGIGSGPARAAHPATAPAEPDISPVEDLMREHGALRRVLLIYEEAIRRIEAKADLPADAVSKAAVIVSTFVHDYHEKLEEEQLFPRFRKAGKHVDLVDVLLKQHQAGRTLTARIATLTTADAAREPASAGQMAAAMRQFIRMYRPHAAREDTVLFPAFAALVPAKEYDKLGDEFEAREQQLFGERGFEKMVERVAGLEKTLRIYDLAGFTPGPAAK